MTLELSLENTAGLSSDVPKTVKIADSGVFRIGRQPDMDWVLPDPSSMVSSHHCEIRCAEPVFELHDLSTNGTFLNGGGNRMMAPHRLAKGDTFAVGPYVIAVAMDSTIEIDPDRTQIIGPPGAGTPAPPPEPGPPPLKISVTAADGLPGVEPRTLDAAGTLTIGRDPAADLVLPDETGKISRRHAEIRLDDAGCTLQDLSVNGIFRGDTADRLESGCKLRNGDTLRIGGYTVTVELSAPLPAPPPPPPPPPKAQPKPEPPAQSRRGGDPAAMAAAPRAQTPTGAPISDAVTAIMKPRPPNPPEKPAPPPAAAEPAAPASPAAGNEIIARVAKALGLSPADISQADPADLAGQLASVVALAAEEMRAMLFMRAETGRTGRPIEAANNNPLEFFPSTDEALRVLFGPPRRAYLDAGRAFHQSFTELRAHGTRTAVAMTTAAKALTDALDPNAISQAARDAGKSRLLIGLRKSELWDMYVARWTAMTGGAPTGAADAFAKHFNEAYEAARFRD